MEEQYAKTGVLMEELASFPDSTPQLFIAPGEWSPGNEARKIEQQQIIKENQPGAPDRFS